MKSRTLNRKSATVLSLVNFRSMTICLLDLKLFCLLMS